MQYVISDIHGNLSAFKKILKKIKFERTKDTLYIAGDILDCNKDGIGIYLFIQPFIAEGSMLLIQGNHELFCEMYLLGEMPKERWEAFGGEPTLKALDRLSPHEQSALLRFLQSLPCYIKIDTERFGQTIITHTGIDVDSYILNPENEMIDVEKSIEAAYKGDKYQYLVSADLHYMPASLKRRLDTFLIVGHVATLFLKESSTHQIYRTPWYIDVDCGAGYKDQGGILACYCIDTDEEFYV